MAGGGMGGAISFSQAPLPLNSAGSPFPSLHQAVHVEVLTCVNPSWRATAKRVSATWEAKDS